MTDNPKSQEEQKNKSFFKSLFLCIQSFFYLVIIILIMTPIIFSVYSLTKEELIIKPFSMPEKLVKQGYSGTVIANQIQDKIMGIKKDVKNQSMLNGEEGKKIKFQSNEKLPDVEVPHMGISLDALTFLLKYLFKENSVSGDIMYHNNTKNENFQLTLRITDKSMLNTQAKSIDEVTEKAAQHILHMFYPVTFGLSYCYDKDAPKLRSLIKDIQENTLSNKDKANVLILESCLWKIEKSYDNAGNAIDLAEKLDKESSLIPKLKGDILKLQIDSKKYKLSSLFNKAYEEYDKANESYRKVIEKHDDILKVKEDGKKQKLIILLKEKINKTLEEYIRANESYGKKNEEYNELFEELRKDYKKLINLYNRSIKKEPKELSN